MHTLLQNIFLISVVGRKVENDKPGVVRDEN